MRLPLLAILAGTGLLAQEMPAPKPTSHHLALQRIGGALMVAVGVLLATGAWDSLMGVLRAWAGAFGAVI